MLSSWKKCMRVTFDTRTLCSMLKIKGRPAFPPTNFQVVVDKTLICGPRSHAVSFITVYGYLMSQVFLA